MVRLSAASARCDQYARRASRHARLACHRGRCEPATDVHLLRNGIWRAYIYMVEIDLFQLVVLCLWVVDPRQTELEEANEIGK